MHGWDPWCSRRWFARRFGVDILLRISAVLGILAGLAMLVSQSASRILVVVAALLALPELPFGVMIGVYTMTHTASRD